MKKLKFCELKNVLGNRPGNRPVMAISLWQPWASLIMAGKKRFETRSWSTEYRGPLVICSAKGGLPKGELRAILAHDAFRQALSPILGLGAELGEFEFAEAARGLLPLGMALGCVDVVDCIGTERLAAACPAGRIESILPEVLFGDFSPGRFAWKLENVRPFEMPVPVKGKQGFFNIKIDCIGGKS